MQLNTTHSPAAANLSASALSRHSLGELLRLELTTAAAIGLRAGGTFHAWRQRAQTRRALARMSAREWRDLGLSRGDVLMEVHKPFWRG